MLKGSRLSSAEVPVTPISMCTCTAPTYSAQGDTPFPLIPVVSQAWWPLGEALMAERFNQSDRTGLLRYVSSMSFFDHIISEMINPLSKSPELIV